MGPRDRVHERPGVDAVPVGRRPPLPYQEVSAAVHDERATALEAAARRAGDETRQGQLLDLAGIERSRAFRARVRSGL